MAQISYFWETTSGTGDSNTGGYSDTIFFELMRALTARTANRGGVCPDYLNELEVTGTASPIAVNTGFAFAYGVPYSNTSSVTVSIPTPAASTRVDYIVLRVDYSAETVRITRIAGTEGAGAPSLTQNAGTTWDIPLATVSINTGGVITVTDAREWIGKVGDKTIDTTKLANNAVAVGQLAQASAGTMLGNFTGSAANITATAVAAVLAQYIHAAATKSSPVSADELALIDSENSNALKRIPYGDLATALGGLVTGSYTPALEINGSSTGITYTSRSAEYWKLGKLCFVIGNIELSSKGASTGAVYLANFPFEAGGGGRFDIEWNGLSSAVIALRAVIAQGNTLAPISAISTATTVSFGVTLQNIDITNTTSLSFFGFYETE